MNIPAIPVVVSSLQDTSRVLSKRGETEMAGLQECAIQLLGYLLLAGRDAVVVQERTAAETTRHMQAVGLTGMGAAQILEAQETALWVGSETSHMVLIQVVNDESDWEALPLQLRNYVSRAQMPCHLVLPIEQLTLDGDTCHRHAVQPVFLVMSRDPKDGLVPAVALASDTFRSALKQHGEEVVLREAHAVLDPYSRVLYAGIAHEAISAPEGVH